MWSVGARPLPGTLVEAFARVRQFQERHLLLVFTQMEINVYMVKKMVQPKFCDLELFFALKGAI